MAGSSNSHVPPKRGRIGLAVVLLVALVVAFVAPQAVAAPLFSPKADFPVGSLPQSVTSADFDGDGTPDLAIANGVSDSVSVLLGTGSGGFATRADFSVARAPVSVTSADFDGDGNPDLATANGGADSVSVLLGTGTGGFGANTDFTTGNFPQSMTSADFDGDGNADLATTRIGPVYDTYGGVSVLLGTGSGGFGPKTDFIVGKDPISVTSADFNGDGNPDLAVTSSIGGRGVSILLGTGGGSFGASTDFTTGRHPVSVTSADFDGDGTPDLAVANNRADSVSVLLGTGSGGFGLKTDFTVGSHPRSVTSADFDGDGDHDLAVANNRADSVSVLLGTGSGGFGLKTDFTVGRHPHSVTSADFDGDGDPDLATASLRADSVSVLLSTGAPNTTIIKQPKAKIKTKERSVKVTAKFTSEDADMGLFKCKLDKADFKRCSSPYEVKAKSKPGKGKKHKISIKAKDEVGNVGEPAHVKFRVIRKG